MCLSHFSESQCQGHSKITAPTQWKQIYGEYLGEEHELPNTTHNTPPPDTCIVRDIKKEQKRVHFEDDANDNKEQERKQSNVGFVVVPRGVGGMLVGNFPFQKHCKISDRSPLNKTWHVQLSYEPLTDRKEIIVVSMY